MKTKLNRNKESINSYGSQEVTAQNAIHSKNFHTYTVFNVIRFCILGAFIFYVNYKTENRLNSLKMQKYCSACYYVAKEPDDYGIDHDHRIGWSYCYPECTNCHTSENNTITSTAEKAFIYSNDATCPIPNYKQKNPPFRWDFWEDKEANNCDTKSRLSVSTMTAWNKSYSSYGYGALFIVLLYATLSLLFVFKFEIWSEVVIMAYNIIVSLVLFYCIFKPYQYYSRQIQSPSTWVDYTGPGHVICQLDSVDEITEDIITVFVWTCIVLVLLQWILCFCRCGWNRWDYKYRTCYWNIERKLIYAACILCVLFFGVLMYCSYRMVEKRFRYNAGNDKYIEEIVYIIVVDVLLIIASLDIFCFKFCRAKGKEYCSYGRRDKGYNYYENFGKHALEELSSPTASRVQLGNHSPQNTGTFTKDEVVEYRPVSPSLEVSKNGGLISSPRQNPDQAPILDELD